MLFVLMAVAFAAAFILASLARTRAKAPHSSCQNNLRILGMSFLTWEGDYGNHYPMSVPTNQGGSMEYLAGVGMFHHLAVMSNEINNPQILICPSDKRTAASSFEDMSNSNLSYYIGLDADERFPSFILSGDWNLITNGVAVGSGLTIIHSNQPVGWTRQVHNGAGNILLADGSVQQTSAASLSNLFQNTGTNITRLAIP